MHQKENKKLKELLDEFLQNPLQRLLFTNGMRVYPCHADDGRSSKSIH